MCDGNKKTCRACKLTFTPSFAFDFYQTGSDPEVGVCERCMMQGITVSKDPVVLPAGYAENVCKSGHAAETCIFLCVGANGERCAKGTPLEGGLLKKLLAGDSLSKGNNCSGAPDFVKT
jgi:hypothetical protein